RAVQIADLPLGQRLGQVVDVELRIGARAGKAAHIDHHHHPGLAQHPGEIIQAAVGMADGCELRHHQPILVSAPPLWAAMWSVLSLLISYCGSSGDARWRWPL